MRDQVLSFASRGLERCLSLALLIVAGSAGSGTGLMGAEPDAAPFKSVPLAVPQAGHSGFKLMSAVQAGITFTNHISEQRHLTNQILLNGSGLAAGDIDGDGWCDLYFCSSDGPNRLYRNLGNWKFQDVTEAAGVACPNLSATGAAFADLDGDGDLDLIVNSVGNGTLIFMNDGKGHFTKSAELNRGKGGMSLAVADLDGDGYLDLYVANYRTSALMDMPNARAVFKTVNGTNVLDRVNGRPLTDPDLTNRFVLGPRGTIEELGQADAIYRNLGGTNFSEIPFTGGTFLDESGRPLPAPPFDWGLTVAIRDLNGDGLPDIYVCNDFETPDRLWLNLGQGHFQAAPRLALRKSSLFSMGADFADVNRDGHLDFFVLDMLNREHALRMTQMMPMAPLAAEVMNIEARPQYMMSTLFLNRGDGTYAEVAQLAGLEASDWSWSPVFLDVDLDGYEDVLVVNGHERAARDLDVAEQMRSLRRTKRNLTDAELFQARRAFPRMATGNLAFRNRGDLTFEETGDAWGFRYRGVSQAIALADLDNDGDLDVIINNSNDAPCLYRNESNAPRLAVQLRGLAPNTFGIGAKIEVYGGPVPQSQEITCGGRYLASDQPMRTFAAGTATNALRIVITWRDGVRTVVDKAEPNRLYTIEETPASKQTGDATPAAASRQTGVGAPLFEDVSRAIDFRHADELFNDFARQPLLPNRLSQLGPGVSWQDVNNDGWEDLIIPSGKGGKLAVFLNVAGSFKRLEGAVLNAPVTRDQTTVLGFPQSQSNVVLLVGSANYEDGLSVGGSVRRCNLAGQVLDDACPGTSSSTGPMALADIDADGDLDLFVGGRCLPGKYPQAASSALYRNNKGNLELDAENSSVLKGVGLVSGAVFTDLDNDGFPELVLACEWGPIRVFHNDHGRFTEITESLGLARYKGWWTSVTAADLDGDGRMDLVVGNWGRNSKYEAHRAPDQPLRIYFGDFDGDGTTDLIEAYFDRELHKIVPERQLSALAQAMPFLRGQFPSHHAYAQADISQILGDRLKSPGPATVPGAASAAGVLEANWLETSVILNRKDHFDVQALPVEAQFSPVFGVAVGDLDGDGHQDIFLAQNFFDAQPETPRYDGGRGLLLIGDGTGEFKAVPGQNSGIRIYGEQRGCALCDYDHDGRLDVAVTQNSAPVVLYHNVSARPGLRVRIKGPPGNLDGVGAVARLVFPGEKFGPSVEVHRGSGYWSQDSPTLVLTQSQPAGALIVRWPGGKETRSELPAGAQEIEVDSSGVVVGSGSR